MPLTQQLKSKYEKLWEQMVFHPFVVEMGDGTLPPEKFKRYFLQDYVFVRDLVSMTSMGMAKAPDMDSASRLHAFLTGILDPENDLFMRAFDELGASEAEYSSASASPTTRGFGDFLVRTGLEGGFEDVLAVLYVTEGTYLDWGTRLLAEGKPPENPIYQEWIYLHGPDVLGDLVAWMGQYLDNADPGAWHGRIDELFHTALRYEYLFWQVAYEGDAWPDD
ncbi:MAG TPA: TenA family protein [SAR202 cluster bacterium]|jgi:thiaminase/transcriptional activator TenA|nr:TenA family protein [SAR202 cluster bacterium]MDP7532827.1 TenA family protein [SAR202 cluster bacterium]HJO81156.1 TenA family protein [SAR202 cluster bacterium]|tara:strand:- start:402 stop:1064 length:663 start_codon:yes stop_codon:yes gene_type:complete